jgi:hypothetical protein
MHLYNNFALDGERLQKIALEGTSEGNYQLTIGDLTITVEPTKPTTVFPPYVVTHERIVQAIVAVEGSGMPGYDMLRTLFPDLDLKGRHALFKEAQQIREQKQYHSLQENEEEDLPF